MNWRERFEYLQQHGLGPEVPELLARLAPKGVQLEDGGGERLRVQAPQGVLTAAERTELDVRKFDLLAWLRGDRAQGLRRLEAHGGRVAALCEPLPEGPQGPAERPYHPLDHRF